MIPFIISFASFLLNQPQRDVHLCRGRIQMRCLRDARARGRRVPGEGFALAAAEATLVFESPEVADPRPSNKKSFEDHKLEPFEHANVRRHARRDLCASLG